MSPWHLTLSSTNRHPLFPSEAQRRAAVCTIVRICPEELALFCVVDDHVHLAVLCDRRRCGYVARAAKLALSPIAAQPLQPVYTKPINHRGHMIEVHRYLLQQPAHHDLACHPALWTGGCFLDLAGARWVPGLQLRLGDVLPRIDLGTSFAHVGLPRDGIAPVDDSGIRSVGAKALIHAAAVACAAAPELESHRAEEVRARRASCVLARQAGIGTSEMSWALGIHPGSVRKLAGAAVEPRSLLATRTYLALEQAVSAAPPFRLPERNANGHRGRF